MRIKNLVLSLALGLTVAAVGAGTVIAHVNEEPLTVAAEPAPEGWIYDLAGTITDWKRVPFTYVEGGEPAHEGEGAPVDYWETSFAADVNDEFKIITKGPSYKDWWMTYGDMGLGGYTDYFDLAPGNDGNARVLQAGNYRIRIARDFANYPDKADGIWVTKTEVSKVEVVYHIGTETLTEEVFAGEAYHPSWKFVDGYYIEGFYTDAAYEHAWPTEGVLATAGEALNVYAKTTICAPEDDYYAYVEAWTDNPFKYVHIFSTTTGAATVWPGIKGEIAPISYVTGEGITLYRVLVPAEYEADMIIFHNNNGEQTGDMPLNGPAVYPSGNKETATGPVEDSADKIAALAFLEHYKTLRKTHEWEGEQKEDSICWIIADAEEWTTLKGLYEAITDKALVDAIKDGEKYTIKDTMDYLYSRMGGTPEGNLPIVFNNDDDTAMIVSLSIVGGLFVIVALGAVLFAKRKRAR